MTHPHILPPCLSALIARARLRLRTLLVLLALAAAGVAVACGQCSAAQLAQFAVTHAAELLIALLLTPLAGRI